MKKLIAMLACLTLVLTMFAGLTVSAATDYGTPTFKLVPRTEADGSLAVIDGCYVVDVVYEGFKNFSPYNGSSRKPSATGIMGLEIYWSNDNETAYTYDGADTGVGVGGTVEVATISATKAADIVTATEGTICSAYYIIKDENAVANLKIDSVVINLRSYVDGAAVEEGKVDLATADAVFKGCTLGKTTPPATESAYNVTYAGDKVVWGDKPATTVSSTDASKTVTFTVKPAFGYVITAVTGVAAVIPEGGEMTATLTADTEINVTVAEKADAAITYDYVTYDENYGWIAFGKVPAGTATYGIELNGTKYAGANAANGAFGVGFKGLAAGSYTAKAYAGETLAATAATITVE